MPAGIEVFFTEMNNPWGNADPGENYWVNVYHPDGDEQIGITATAGHASIDLFPGRYVVAGTTGGCYRNFDSNEVVVNVGCEERVCITLIPRSLHSCVWWTYVALAVIAQRPHLAREIAEPAWQALDVLQQIERGIPDEHRMREFFKEGLAPVARDLDLDLKDIRPG